MAQPKIQIEVVRKLIVDIREVVPSDALVNTKIWRVCVSWNDDPNNDIVVSVMGDNHVYDEILDTIYEVSETEGVDLAALGRHLHMLNHQEFVVVWPRTELIEFTLDMVDGLLSDMTTMTILHGDVYLVENAPGYQYLRELSTGVIPHTGIVIGDQLTGDQLYEQYKEFGSCHFEMFNYSGRFKEPKTIYVNVFDEDMVERLFALDESSWGSYLERYINGG